MKFNFRIQGNSIAIPLHIMFDKKTVHNFKGIPSRVHTTVCITFLVFQFYIWKYKIKESELEYQTTTYRAAEQPLAVDKGESSADKEFDKIVEDTIYGEGA